MVKYFNEIGLTTKYSCQGVDGDELFEIMFEDNVTDDMITDFINTQMPKFNYDCMHGAFYKWIRRCHHEVFFSNWLYQSFDSELADLDLKIFVS